MTIPRKTIEVERIKDKVNYYLRKQDTTPEGRHAVSNLLGLILQETGNYQGFYFSDGHLGKMDTTRRQYF